MGGVGVREVPTRMVSTRDDRVLAATLGAERLSPESHFVMTAHDADASGLMRVPMSRCRRPIMKRT